MRRGVHPETSCVCSCPTSCRASRACRADRQQQQGISTLFPARHGFPYVGRMSGMSGAPDFMGYHAGRMEGHGPDAARGRHGRRAPHRTAFPLAAGLSGRPRPACGLHTGQVRQLGCAGASILKRHAFAVARHHVKGTTKTPQGQELNLHTADINTPAPLPNRGTLAGNL